MSDIQVTDLGGGTLRAVHGVQAAGPSIQTQPEPHKVHSGALQFNAATGEVTKREQARFTVGQDTPVASTVAQSLRREMGGQMTVQAQPGVEGTRVDARVAVRMGLLRETAPNIFEDVQQQAAEGQPGHLPDGRPEPPQAPQAPVDGAFDAGDAEAWAEDIAPLEQGVYDQAVNQTISAVVRADSTEAAAGLLAAQAGISPELAQSYVNEGGQMYQRAADRALHTAGLVDDETRQAFYAHLRAQPGNLQHAINQLVRYQDAGFFRRLATQWQQDTGRIKR